MVAIACRAVGSATARSTAVCEAATTGWSNPSTTVYANARDRCTTTPALGAPDAA